ncbi:uncharacterized protein LOC134254670 [Saccostrea cucullata]|uniref:uncharacterized protein LOC134254670 n=1 Tax=Saccostrea cuccullata TaxID=36930 RepID=UPI002ECFD472
MLRQFRRNITRSRSNSQGSLYGSTRTWYNAGAPSQPPATQPATDEEEGAHCPALSSGLHLPRRSVDPTETFSSILGSKDRLRPHMEERICGVMQPSVPSPLKRSLPTQGRSGLGCCGFPDD